MREANRMNELKRRIEWPLMIAAMTGVLILGTAACADNPLGPETAVQIRAEATAEQEQQDAGSQAGERQRDKNARSNGAAALD